MNLNNINPYNVIKTLTEENKALMEENEALRKELADGSMEERSDKPDAK